MKAIAGHLVTTTVALLSLSNSACLGQELIERPSSLKLGVVDIEWVRSHAPAKSDPWKAQAETRLKKEVEEAAQRIRSYEAQGVSKKQIQELTDQETNKLLPQFTDVQWQLGKPEIAAFYEKLHATTRSIAEEHDLDLVVGKSGVFTVGNPTKQSMLDVTAELCRRLNLPEPP